MYLSLSISLYFVFIYLAQLKTVLGGNEAQRARTEFHSQRCVSCLVNRQFYLFIYLINLLIPMALLGPAEAPPICACYLRKSVALCEPHRLITATCCLQLKPICGLCQADSCVQDNAMSKQLGSNWVAPCQSCRTGVGKLLD